MPKSPAVDSVISPPYVTAFEWLSNDDEASWVAVTTASHDAPDPLASAFHRAEHLAKHTYRQTRVMVGQRVVAQWTDGRRDKRFPKRYRPSRS